MATHLITPNEAADGSHGGETSVLLMGGRTSPLIIANPLIPRLFEEVSEGVRALPRGGAEIGGLLVGPKDHQGGVLTDEIIPIPIEYRFGPSFRLSSPDLTKIEEAIASAHKDPLKTVVGFYRSRTRGGDELRESDQEILLAVEMAHAAFDTDFQYYAVLSPPNRGEMSLALAVRKGSEWSEFRPFTSHLNPLSVTSDWGDPEPEPMEVPVEPEAPAADLEPEWTNASCPEFVDVQAEAPTDNDHEPAIAEPEAHTDNGHEPEMAAPEAIEEMKEENLEPALAESEIETMNAHSEESVMVETEALPGDVHEPAKADMEPVNGNGHMPPEAPARKTARRRRRPRRSRKRLRGPKPKRRPRQPSRRRVPLPLPAPPLARRTPKQR